MKILFYDGQKSYLRVRFWVVIICIFAAIQSCKSTSKAKQEMVPVESVEQANLLIEQYHGKAANFRLPVPQTTNLTLHGEAVSRDIAMAIITDHILAKGWLPNGFDEKGQIRYYKYSE